MRRASVVALLVITAVAPCAVRAQAAKNAEAAPMPIPRTVDELRAELQKVVDSTKVPGVGFAVFTRDSLLYAGGVGYADVAAKKPIDGDTHFRVGSISKSFVSTALLMLQRAGRVDLNAPIKTVVPDVVFENRWESSDPVRVVHLLEHTTGFDDMHFNAMYNVREAPDLPLHDAVMRAAKSLHTRWRPGERFSYSNPGYGVAGYVIEKVSGVPYDRFIKDSILTPLGMTTSAFSIAESARPLMAQGYHAVTKPPVGYPAIYLRPAGDLHASPRELARFAQMLMRRGDAGGGKILLDSASVDRMERVGSTLAAERGLAAGYGLGNYTELSLPIEMHGHDGGIDGFVSSYRYSVPANVGIVALVNSDASGAAIHEVQRLLVVYALGDNPVLRAPAPVTVPASTLGTYAGYYQDVAPRNQLLSVMNWLMGGMTVAQRGDSLFASAVGDSAVKLIAVNDSTFRRANESGPSIGFYHDRAGKLVLTGTRYMERVSPWPRRLVLGGLIAAAILFASAVLAALVWVPRAMFGKTSNATANRLRATVLFAVLTIGGFAALVITSDFSKLGVMTPRAVAIFIFSLLVPIVALIAFLTAARAPRAVVGRFAKVHSFLVALAAVGFSLLLIVYDLTGLRTWAF
jgi:CubicO group peptidase (beta-lactamase class C family)